MLDSFFSLKEKKILITGGYSYLGKAISEVLAMSGGKVIVLGKDEEKFNIVFLHKRKGIFFEKFDISDSLEKIEKKFGEISNKYGKFDVLINNANFSKWGTLSEISFSDWEKGIEGTVHNYFKCIRGALKYFNRKGGSIINIASMYGIVVPSPDIYTDKNKINPPNYGVGKAGIIHLTKYAAMELAGRKIRVNAISPGAFPNPNVRKDKKFIKKLEKKIPLGRVGEPNELQGVVLLLASQASSYITGQNFIVDGGWTIW